MQKQRLILPIAIILVMTFAITLVSAAVVLNSPVEGGNYSSTMAVNCTTTFKAPVNASIYYNSSGGNVNATTGTILTTIVNDTANDVYFYNGAVSISGLTDLTTYNFTCVTYNITGSEEVDATEQVGSVTVDNTAPTVTATTDYSSVNLGRYFKYTISITDATSGIEGSYCNMTDAEGELDKDGTISTSASSVEFKYTDVAGSYNISCSATDYAGNTKPGSVTVTAKTTGAPIDLSEEGEIPTIGLGDKLRNLDQKTIIIAGIVVLLIAMAMRKK